MELNKYVKDRRKGKKSLVEIIGIEIKERLTFKLRVKNMELLTEHIISNPITTSDYSCSAAGRTKSCEGCRHSSQHDLINNKTFPSDLSCFFREI